MKSPRDSESGDSASDDQVAESATSKTASSKNHGWLRRSFNPFRIATLRGLAVVLPPLLTIMLFVWAWNTIDRAIIGPVESMTRYCVAWAIEDIRSDQAVTAELTAAADPGNRLKLDEDQQIFTADDGTELVKLNDQWLPLDVYDQVKKSPGEASLNSAHDYYSRYVQIRYLKRHLVIPALLAILLAVMYLTGKLLAVGIGKIFWHWFESLINRVPIIRNVYSSVKQVTDFAFSENDIEFTRVVAVEYPRKGIWSIGFVTGESFIDIRKAVGEPMLSVLMPTSPMPATGFTITVPKSETIELDITIDQAIQFCVSCGVVVPGTTGPAVDGKVVRNPVSPSPVENSPAMTQDQTSRFESEEE